MFDHLNPKYFSKKIDIILQNCQYSVVRERQKRMVQDSGAKLASRALAWGTLYAIGGCSVIFYGMWKLSGATNLVEFREKAGNILPKIPKNNPPQSRTEFSGINDFLQYIIDKDLEEKRLKKEAHQAQQKNE